MAATTYTGTRNSDRLSARTSGDTLEGLAGNDILSSGTTALTGVYLFGGDGNDTLIAKPTDTLIDGGAGTDTVHFAVAVTTGDLGNADLESVENVVLTSITAGLGYDFSVQTEALNITGTRLVDSIKGGTGNDTITGGLGADSLYGHDGDDVLVAEATDAVIDGGTGTNTVHFAAAVASHGNNGWLTDVQNVVITNTGNAAYDFSDQTEALNIMGDRGKDTITGGANADTLSGGNGNDVLVAVGTTGGALVQDTLVDGGAGNDTVKYGAHVIGLADAALVNVEYVVITAAGGGWFDFSNQTEGLDITGAGDPDAIWGGSGADALRGGLGNDALYAGDNDKLIDGGNGADYAAFAASVSAKNLLDADLINVETIWITGTGAYDFSAQSEKLVITAIGGAVTLTGGKGVDTLTGGNYDDVIIASDLDMINGGASGTDTVRFAAAVSAANLGQNDLVGIENIVITNTKAATYDFSVQTEILNITGSSGNDTIKAATGTADTISGGAGNDVLVVEDLDVIDGGTGTDTVYFGATVTVANLLDADLVNVENVLLTDGITADFSVQTESLQISGSLYTDIIEGGLRADTIIGGAGADYLSGNDGADILIADTSDVMIDGGDGTDTVRFAAAVTNLLDNNRLINVENVVITNTGNAAYYFGDQTEALNITGNSGADTLTGGSAADTLSGGAGNDVLVAAATDALIDGGAGTDTVRFAAAVTTANLVNADLVNVERVEITNTTSAAVYDFGVQTEALTIVGNTNVDSVTGGTGNDSISGEAGADVLTGGAGADTLVGGVGNDILTGGDGVDSLVGGDGDDTLNAQDTDARIDGGSDTSQATTSPGAGDTARFAAGVTALNLTDAKLVGIENVVITNSAAASYDFSAQTEALIITGGAAADTITGTQDWDTFKVSATSDVDAGESYNGGAGTDTLSVTAGGLDLSGLTSLTSVEVITLTSGTNTFAASALTGDTIAISGTATMTVNGTAVGETINLSGLTFSSGITINGLDGDDVITGTGGADTITGGAGADTITGGAGADVFVKESGSYAAGMDVIQDFSTDTIDAVIAAGTKTFIDAAALTEATILAILNTSDRTVATGTAVTQFYNVNGSGDSIILLDDAASGTWDAAIKLVGVVADVTGSIS